MNSKKTDWVHDWVIGICSSEANGVRILRFRGSVEEMKAKLLSLIEADRNRDSDNWEHGSENIEEIDDLSNGLGYELYGYGNYVDYHVDYTAKVLAHVAMI